MSKKPTIYTADSIPEGERPLGRMLADAHLEPFEPLRSREAAQADPHGYVILQGDDGGQIYLVVRASEVHCSAQVLDRLLRDIDEMEWPGNPEDMRKIFYERLGEGSRIAGGMGGAEARAEPWIHQRLESQGLREAILAVLSGQQERLPRGAGQA